LALLLFEQAADTIVITAEITKILKNLLIPTSVKNIQKPSIFNKSNKNTTV